MRLRQYSLSTAVLCLFAASPSLAAAPAKPANKAAPTVAAVSPVKSQPDFGAMLAIFDKMFPPQPDPDPAQLALARTSVQSMWPNGAYGQIMTSFLGTIVDRAMQLKTSDFAAMGGPGAKPAAGTDLSLHDTLAGKDPYFDQRVAALRQVATDEMGKVSAILDPRIREGLARAMARKFGAQQLADINRFFATPAGQKFAGESLRLWIDPDAMRAMVGSMPEMMKLMPEMMEKLKAANDKFPKPPKAAEPAKPKQTIKPGKKAAS